MWRAQGVVLAALTISLSTYGLDCLGMSTPDGAMGCCKAMRCHYHKHRGHNGKDCCETTPQMHAVPARPVAAPTITSPSIPLLLVSAVSHYASMESHQYVIAPHTHDPPAESASTLPLRL